MSMRADRLLSILMLLQGRGRMTAHALAAELEVSERTIYRDIDALSMAGVPIYAERGPGGGCALLDSYRTTLTGLTEAEVRALLMLSIPAPLDELGLSGELKAALRKLLAALPAGSQHDAAQVRQRIHLDSAPWPHRVELVPHLHTIQQGVWQNRRLRLTYHTFMGTSLTRTVAPYGLVAKHSRWQLVCERAGHLRVVPVAQVVAADLLAEAFTRPPDFDLAAFWQDWRSSWEASAPRYLATVRASPALLDVLPVYFGWRAAELLDSAGPPDADGWRTLTLPFESLDAARERILGLGCAVEVLAPEPLRLTVQDYARQIVRLYGE
jgi:predicted DNA-binding transcriptional regulator YafY